MKVIASIEDPGAIRQILEHLHRRAGQLPLAFGPLEELGVTLTPKRSLAVGGQDVHIAAIAHFGDGKIEDAQRGDDDDRREE